MVTFISGRTKCNWSRIVVVFYVVIRLECLDYAWLKHKIAFSL